MELINLNIPIEIYSNFDTSILKIIVWKTFDTEKGFVTIQIEPEYENIFKMIVEKADPNNEAEKSEIKGKLINNQKITKTKKSFDYIKLFNVLKDNKILTAMELMTKISTSDLAFFKYIDVPIIATKETIAMLNDIAKKGKTIEVNSGTGVLGSEANIKSFSSKVYSKTNTELFDYISKFKTFLNLSPDKKQPKLLSIDFIFSDINEAKNIVSSFTKENVTDDNITSFIHRRESDIQYINIAFNLFNLSFLNDLSKLDLIHTDEDGNPFIILGEIQEYLLSYRSVDAIYKKQLEDDGNFNIGNIKQYVNKDIKIFYNINSDFSRKLEIMLALHFLNFEKVCDFVFTKKLHTIDEIKECKHLKYLSSETQPKGFPKMENYSGILLEQINDYYSITNEELKSFTQNDYDFSTLISAIADNSVKLSKKELIFLIKTNKYLNQFIDYLDGVEDEKDLDDIDYEWLHLQYSNMSRILIIYLKKITRYIPRDIVRIPINKSTFTPADIEKAKRFYYGFTNAIDYPERVETSNYMDAIQKSFSKNENGVVIAYNPSNEFNLNKVFDISKSIELFCFGRIESLGRNSFYKAHSYALLASEYPKIVSPYSSLIESEADVILYIKNHKNKTGNVDEFVKTHNLKILSKNF